jgi:hypothetical protein
MSIDPVQLVRSRATSLYQSITFITTYQCTAACKECCFESSPTLDSGKLTFEFMKGVMDEAIKTLPSLKLVVFSGGECFMLKDQLFKTIAHATHNGLHTRCVTNGYWGKTPASAARNAARLRDAGISEMNISTGMDHQEWVPLQSVVNCAEALLRENIFTLVTIEKDTAQSTCWETAHDALKALREAHPAKLRIICNSWMPFHKDAVQRADQRAYNVDKGCDQLFSNLVITPYKMLSACCGLTYEHIPEMRMGLVGAKPLGGFVTDIAEDFLKIWIHMDGPKEIVRKITGKPANELMDGTVHICQACAILHQNEPFRKALQARYQEFLPEVVGRFLLRKAIMEVSCRPREAPAVEINDGAPRKQKYPVAHIT